MCVKSDHCYHSKIQKTFFFLNFEARIRVKVAQTIVYYKCTLFLTSAYNLKQLHTENTVILEDTTYFLLIRKSNIISD